jgi:cytochrome c oxidase subunit 3
MRERVNRTKPATSKAPTVEDQQLSILKALMAKPWLKTGDVGDFPAEGVFAQPTAKVGLVTFLCVATSIFGLFIVSYNFRMELGDWLSVPKPGLLWFNTVLLILSSVAFQWTRVAGRQDDSARVRFGLIAGGISSIAFIGGQFLAWRELSAAGYYLAANPANDFFYLITALHGAHVLGGLWVWGRTVARMLGGEDVRLSVELCTVYWHYLLVVWIVLFGLLLST